MKRLLAALAGFVIICLCFSALASDLDDEFAEAFDSFRIDPFADFDPGFDEGDDPFTDGDLPDDPFADDGDSEGAFGNAYMSYGSSAAEDEEDPFADPDGGSLPDPTVPTEPAAKGSGSLKVNIGGEALELKFDASPTYSSIEDHLLQAAFYTYGASSGNLYELFLSFPDTVKAGESITPEIAMKSELNTALVLLVSTATEDTYYVASQQSTSGPYPETSSYTLSFDAVTDNGDTTTYVGRFTADLVSYSPKTGQIDKTMHIEEAAFDFTIAKETARSADDGDKGKDASDPFDAFTDLPTIAPEPTPTIAPDFRKV